jgi:hypothetical protein
MKRVWIDGRIALVVSAQTAGFVLSAMSIEAKGS